LRDCSGVGVDESEAAVVLEPERAERRLIHRYGAAAFHRINI
jgi:hypothetical protein